MSLSQIEKLCEKYSAAANELFADLNELDAAIALVTKDFKPQLDKLVKKVAKAQSELHAAVEDHPECFEKPRTQTFAGIKVGFQKGKDKLVIPDAEKTTGLITKHFPEMASVLLQTTVKPVDSAVRNLDAKQLKLIAVSIDPATDDVVVKPVDSAIGKAVSAQLKEAAK